MKKLISVILVFCVFFNLNTMAMPFSDVPSGTEEWEAIEKLWFYGYINGYNENTFAPQNNLTRAEFVKIINNIFSYTEKAENPFTDISENDWFYEEILKAVQMGYINGMGDGRFCPNDKVTREQVCVILNNILNMEMLPVTVEISDSVSDWAEDSVKKVISSGLASLDENGAFRATVPITRGEASVILAKCVIDKPETIEPIDLSSLAEEVLVKRMTSVISTLRGTVIPLCYLDAQRDVIQSIIVSMETYLEDRSFDYKKASEDTFRIYATMEDRKDRVALQNMITENLKLDDLLILYDFFFPTEI